jgi:hypothetical protein
MLHLVRPVLVAALCVSLHSAGVAHAQPAPDPEAVIASAEYKELVREGMLKYTRGLWDEARAYFQKAHQLAPNARTLRGLALVAYDSHHYVEAIDRAEQSLAHRVAPVTDKMKAELEQLMQQAQAQVVHAELITTPADAALRVDGVPVPRRADGTVWLDPGDHALTVSAPGHLDDTRPLQLAEARQLRLEIALRSSSADLATRAAAPAAEARAPERSPLPWVVAGVSAAVAAAGGVMLAVDQANEGSSAATPLGAAVLGVGAVGVIVGITWSLAPHADSERAPAARLRLGPTAIQYSGTF